MHLDRQTKMEALEAFEYRYPVAGETIHALLDAYGGVDGLLEDLERRGFDLELYGWMTARKTAGIKLQHLRELIPQEKIEEISRRTGIPVESAEMQCAQYLPRFFKTLVEDIDGMGFLWEHHPSHSTQSRLMNH